MILSSKGTKFWFLSTLLFASTNYNELLANNIPDPPVSALDLTTSVLNQIYSRFRLEGHISDMPDNAIIYLVRDSDTIAESRSINGKFFFSGRISGGTNYYFLKSNKASRASNALWLENKDMVLTGSLANFSKLMLSGSTSHDEYTYIQGIEGDNKQAIFLQFIDSHRESLYVPFLLTKIVTADNIDEVKRLYAQLSEASRYSTYGAVLKDMIEIRDVYRDFFSRGPVGTIIPNFKLKDEHGKIVKIHDIIYRNEFTLLDYWASWCFPCRAAMPGMISVYKEFNKYGFNIIGVSTDKNSNKWKQAVKKDGVPWSQMIDNVDNSSKSYFEMVAIPGYVIVDKTGKILYADYISKASGKNFGFARLSPTDSLQNVVKGLVSESHGIIYK